MRGLGLLVLLVGASEFAFRYVSIGMDHPLFKHFGEHRTTAAIAFLAVGALLTIVGFRKKKDKK